MRSARRNIGEHSANLSSLAAAGPPDDRWRMETAGKGSTKSPSSSVQAVAHSRWRHIGTHIVSFSSVLGTVSDGLVLRLQSLLRSDTPIGPQIGSFIGIQGSTSNGLLKSI